MRVAIVGAGPAGAHLAHELSSAGAEVRIFDARECWEKPCGGGVTSKALAEFPFLLGNESPKQMVSSLRLISAGGREVTVAPRSAFAIYSRRELGRLLRERAIAAGANLRCERVERTTRVGSSWRIETATENFEVDLLIGADGASSVIRRRVGVEFGREDFAYGLGWHVYGTEPAAHVDVQYLDEFTGYLWLFPRTDHLSYGIASGYREATPAQLKAKLLDYIDRQNPAAAAAIRAGSPETRFYAAMIPALGVASWDRLRASDPRAGWALVGDAAGFVDPLTGEGIYYAIKSASLLARAITDQFDHYEEMWRESFGGELRRAAQLSDKFYSGNYAGAPMSERMVQLATHHRGVRETLRDLIAGEQGYIDLKQRLVKNALRLW
jgi:geranylgeranyl reductase family protein